MDDFEALINECGAGMPSEMEPPMSQDERELMDFTTELDY